MAGSHAISRRAFLLGGAASAGSLVLGRSATATPKTLDIICKGAWGAGPPQGKFVRHHVKRLTVHHSAVVLKDNRKAPSRFRDHQAYHQSLGWPDIAYHMLIDAHGNIYRGRPSWARGDTRTDYDPAGHLLVLCEGNFEEQEIPRAQVRALVDVLAWASARWDVPPYRIRGHRDYAATACPGQDLYNLIDRGPIRRRVRRRLAEGGVQLDGLCGRAGRRRVRQIENGTD